MPSLKDTADLLVEDSEFATGFQGDYISDLDQPSPGLSRIQDLRLLQSRLLAVDTGHLTAFPSLRRVRWKSARLRKR